MNIVVPIDFRSFSPSQDGLGTVDARVENGQRNIIESAQNTSDTKQTGQDSQSGSKSNNQEGFSAQYPTSQDKVILSIEGKKAAEKEGTNALSEEDQKQVKDLKDRDREVKVHEQAHAAVGGQYAGSPSYEYQTGPDGKRYAVGGEVSIDVSEEEKPEDTIQKMQIVRAAALAPAEPSTQDLKVAAEASQKENQARSQVSQKQLNGSTTDDALSASSVTKESEQSAASKQAQAYKDVSAYQPSRSFSVSA